jgi:hypothetical protein
MNAEAICDVAHARIEPTFICSLQWFSCFHSEVDWPAVAQEAAAGRYLAASSRACCTASRPLRVELLLLAGFFPTRPNAPGQRRSWIQESDLISRWRSFHCTCTAALAVQHWTRHNPPPAATRGTGLIIRDCVVTAPYSLLWAHTQVRIKSSRKYDRSACHRHPCWLASWKDRPSYLASRRYPRALKSSLL